MEVPFSSSGALSRRHYGLVRVVELSSSTQEANNILHAEIQAVRVDMARADLTFAQCMEYLIILLYCFNTIEIGFSPGSIAFALPHAVNLAEAGKTIEQKRIGYVFCAEFMPPDGEMQLMLVNTVRKDLESSSVARMCLALQSLIAVPTEHVVPAVQSRVQELISHNSPQIRRRAIHACRLLSHHERSLLMPVTSVLLKRLGDPDRSVVRATLLAVSSPAFRDISDAKQLSKVKTTIHDLAFNNDVRPYVLNVSAALSAFGITFEDGISRLCEYIRDSTKKHDFLMLREAFSLLSQYTVEQLKRNLDISPVSYVRSLLASDDPNLHYLFLVCLDSLDAEAWSGSTDIFPSVLDDWEMEKIMHMIDSPDVLIRTKTLSILNGVDQNIADAVYARLLQSLPPNANNRMRNECIVRLLEVVNTKTAGDGESYARGVAELFASIENALSDLSVSEAGVDRILSYLQYSSDMFQVQCAASLLAMITEEESNFGPTMLVVISALSAQYCTHVSVPPADILSGIALRLADVPASVQDACILAMLRLAAICDVSDAVRDAVVRVNDKAGRHIRKRCMQFQTLLRKREDLQNIIKKSQSSSLPDFLHSLESYENEAPRASRLEHLAMSQSSTLSSSKLRYEAYDTPRSTPKLRSSRERSNIPAAYLNTSAVEMGEDTTTNSSLTTMTDAMSRVDLIAFDQPAALITDDRTTFTAIWDTMEASGSDMRGWSDAKVEDLIKNLQTLEGISVDIIPAHEPPFYGEVKVKITADHDQWGAVKFRASDEGGTLWRVRTEAVDLGRRLKAVLTI
ncbi:armadillo-type protein [Amanita rubescens]|nr:armadillo-type protein [Amanita rubescens]